MSGPDPIARTVAVVGLGLIGGSLARAVKALPGHPRVLGASPDEGDRRAAAAAGIAVEADAARVLGEADVVVYAAPLAAILDLLPRHAPLIRPDALVTDVAGLKRPVLDAAGRAGLGDRFVGAHPLAGGTGTGFAEGRATLFSGARVFVCPHPAAGADVTARADRFWREVGGSPIRVGAHEHDRLMVRISHLPQLVANALALALDQEGVAADDLGPGGRDMTRLAQSGPRMWGDLFAHSGPEAAGLLREVAGALERLADGLAAGDGAAVAELMARTRAWRARGSTTEELA